MTIKPDWSETPMRPSNAELISILVSHPVEAAGILSRIETHVTALRDFLHGAMRDPVDGSDFPALVLLRELNIEAQNAANRHEFMREHIVQLLDMLHAEPGDATILQDVAHVRDGVLAMEQRAIARHEFMRDALVAVGNDVLAIKARENMLGAVVAKRLDMMDQRLAALESYLRPLQGNQTNDGGTDGN